MAGTVDQSEYDAVIVGWYLWKYHMILARTEAATPDDTKAELKERNTLADAWTKYQTGMV